MKDRVRKKGGLTHYTVRTGVSPAHLTRALFVLSHKAGRPSTPTQKRICHNGKCVCRGPISVHILATHVVRAKMSCLSNPVS